MASKKFEASAAGRGFCFQHRDVEMQGADTFRAFTALSFRLVPRPVSSQTKSKRILPTSFTGHKGVLLIDTVVTNMGWLFTPTLAHTDGGVDGFIEIPRSETDELTNLILRVQSKATSKEWTAETDESFEYRCTPASVSVTRMLEGLMSRWMTPF